MLDYDVLNEKEEVWLPSVYSVVALVEKQHEKRPISSHNFIHEQMRNLYRLQPSFAVGLPVSTLDFDRNGLLVHCVLIDWAVQKVVPMYIQPHFL